MLRESEPNESLASLVKYFCDISRVPPWLPLSLHYRLVFPLYRLYLPFFFSPASFYSVFRKKKQVLHVITL